MKNNNKENRKCFYDRNKKFYLESYWNNNNENNFYKPNGFQSLPEDIYRAFAMEIDKDGKVLDLGCGNGLMLQCLKIYSGYKLVPYGVDFTENSIKQARKILHPNILLIL